MPRVSVGIPVYNGERYIEETINSLRAQTLHDIEIIVCDNASTDATETIVRALATEDPRVRYYRNGTNLGAAPNYNRTFELSTAPLFHWHGHDDICAPTYLQRCVDALDADQEAVLCQTGAVWIDKNGEPFALSSDGKYWSKDGACWIEPPDELDVTSDDPYERYKQVAANAVTCVDALGVIRRDVMAKTGLFGSFDCHDRPFIVELAIYGRFIKVPEPLFFKREHPSNSRSMGKGNRRLWASTKGSLLNRFPRFQQQRQIAHGIQKAPIPLTAKLRCLGFGLRKALLGAAPAHH